MGKLIIELRRRHVFRATGLYVGVAWIVLQGADVLLPAFPAPDWVFRALVIVAIAGTPLTAILAWIYEYTDRGIERQETVEVEHQPRTQGRQMDFVVIGVLVVALSFSVYLNLKEIPAPSEVPEPVPILIADFDNQTGDTVFDGVLELALTVGLESAPFITAYNRNHAVTLAGKIKDDAESLDVAASRLVAVQETIKFVLAGTIRPEGATYVLSVVMLDPADGRAIAEATAAARDKAEIFGAVGSLAGQLRVALGDRSIDPDEMEPSEIFTATSLEAVSNYNTAQMLAYKGRTDEALEYYQRAIDADPNFGRTFSSMALALHSAGRIEEAEALWQKAMFSMDTMTERERLWALGRYYANQAGNWERAKDTYERLVERYPADQGAQHNLAIAYFLELDFQRAQEKGLRLVKIYPNSAYHRQNLALYAMYAGDFETASTESEKTLELDGNRIFAWLVLAMARVSVEDFDGARAAYEAMAAVGDRGQSYASVGIADLEMLRGNYASAAVTLLIGIEQDEVINNVNSVAVKRAMLADALAATGNAEEAKATLQPIPHVSHVGGSVQDALALNSYAVPTALASLRLGDTTTATNIAETLGGKPQPQSRAYAAMIVGMLALKAGEQEVAIKKLSAAIDISDLWLIRLQLGIAYLEAGYAAEALSEFELCQQRVAETTSLFRDDRATWRHSATLKYWEARAHEAIDMKTPAVKGYKAFLALRSETADDPLTADARRRMLALATE